VLTAILLALAVMLLVNAGKSITLDESITLERTTPPLGRALRDLFVESQKPPVYFLLVYGLRRFFPSLEAVRLFSAATILGLFFVMHRVSKQLDLATGWRSPVILAAATPALLWAGAEARFYALTALLLCISTGFFVRLWVLDTDRPVRDGIWFVVINYLALLTFYYSAFVIAGQLAAAMASRRWKRWFAAGVGLVALMLPWAALIISQASMYSRAPVDAPRGVEAGSLGGSLYLLGRGAIWTVFRDPPVIHRPALLVGITVIVVAIVAGAYALPDRRRTVKDWQLVILATLPVAALWVMRVANRFRVEDRHWMILAPALILLLASLAARIRIRALRDVLWIALLAAFGVCAISFARNDRGPRDYRTAVRLLMDREHPGEPILFYWTNPLPFRYYYSGPNTLLPLHPGRAPDGGVFVPAEEQRALRATIAGLGARGAFWVFEESNRIESSKLVLPGTLGYPLHLVSEAQATGLRLLRFEPPAPSREGTP